MFMIPLFKMVILVSINYKHRDSIVHNSYRMDCKFCIEMTIIHTHTHTHTHTQLLMLYHVFYDFTVGFWLHHVLLSWSSVTFTSSIHACTCVLWSRRLHFSCNSCSSRLNREGHMDLRQVST